MEKEGRKQESERGWKKEEFLNFLFLQSGNCEVNKKDIYGRSAIFFAAYTGSSECVFFLLESGCDLADSAVPYIRNRGFAAK